MMQDEHGKSKQTLIMIVDDDAALGEMLSIVLNGSGFEAVTCQDGLRAVEMFPTLHPDLVLLDIMLPGLDGVQVAQRIRQTANTPIIMLTAKSDTTDVVKGLEAGADDYVVKPFSLAVLYAKALALLRRARGLNAGNTLTAGTLSLDPERGIVTANGRRIDLPPKEFALLRALMERKNRVLTRDELLNLAWGWDFDGTDRVIDGHIKKLRRALGPHADCIKTVVKRGYKLEVDGDENQT